MSHSRSILENAMEQRRVLRRELGFRNRQFDGIPASERSIDYEQQKLNRVRARVMIFCDIHFRHDAQRPP